jgi:conjugal transfer pilus assembly protein TrbC
MLFSLSIYASNESSKSSTENTKSNIIIFVSFSMPKESLKTWMQEGSKIGASVVMRGLVNNSFKDTIGAIYDLIKDHQAHGIAIDPTLFKKFNIDKVPAVVVVDSFENYDVVFGNVTLDYALGVIANHGEVGKNQVQKEIEKLRGKHD